MQRSFRFARLVGFILLFFIVSLLPLIAQPGETCLLSFEPQYMGQGNCYRAILRNNDPQLSPYWVQYRLLDQGAIEAGNVEPLQWWGRDEYDRWYFSDRNPLAYGDVDTGYFCFAASTSSVRLAVVWVDMTGTILCRDTVHLAMPQIIQGCFEVTNFRMSCSFPEAGSADDVLSKGIGFGFQLPIEFSVNFLNTSGKAVSSTLLSGPDCMSGTRSFEVQRFPIPLAAGAETGFIHWGQMSPDDPICFDVNDEGWNLIPLEITLQDETNADICSDSVVILISQFACTPGGITDFAAPDHSTMDLHFVSHAAGEASISFTLEKSADVRLSLIDMRGNEVLCIIDNRLLESGENRVMLNTAGIGSGTYVCLLQADGIVEGATVQIVR